MRVTRQNVTHKSASVVPRLSEFSYDHADPSVPGWYAVKFGMPGGPNYCIYEVARVGRSLRLVEPHHDPMDPALLTMKQARADGYSFGPLLFRLEDDDA